MQQATWFFLLNFNNIQTFIYDVAKVYSFNIPLIFKNIRIKEQTKLMLIQENTANLRVETR